MAGSGIGIMEHSHRGKVFDKIIDEAEQDCRDLAGISDGYEVLFLQGGASLQFAMVPMNLLPAGRTADYLRDRRLVAEGGEGGEAPGRQGACRGQQRGDQVRPDPGGGGDQVLRLARRTCTSPPTTRSTAPSGRSEPPVPAGVPLVADTSSDMFSRPIDVGKYGLIYAGAQKNLGPSGVVLVIIRKDLVEAGAKDLPTMLQYRTHAEEKSLYNTPPTFGIYVMGQVFKWIKDAGRPRGDGGAQREQGEAALRLPRPERVLPRHGAAGQPLADERLLPRADARSWRASSSARRPSAASTGSRATAPPAACGPASTMPVPAPASRRWWRS